ncbi:hypothetical protein Tco_1192534 [Tanacetum coccineum]
MPRKKFNVLDQHLQEIMEESLPKMVDDRVKELTKTQVPVYVAQGLIMERQQSQADVAKMIEEQYKKNARIFRQIFLGKLTMLSLTIFLLMLIHLRRLSMEPVSGESSSGQVNESEPGPSMSGNQEQLDDFDFWTDSYATNDDELPTEKVSQELMDEMLQTVDEARLCKENEKEILISPHPQRSTLVVQSCQRDPKAHALSLVNQDLLNLKKGSLGPKKIMMSLHKFPAVIFPDDDIEERTSRWVDKCVNKFNLYARYNVKHWKNTHANIFYIKKQKEPRKPKEVVYSNSKIVQIIKTYWEPGHKHKFITYIIARRENGSIVSITKSDYKNLNKNDIKDMYLLIVNGNVEDYAETGLLWSLSGVHIEKYKVFSIVSEPVYGIIYKSSKKEKRVTRHQEIHKFCDATLKGVLEGLKSYNNDVKHGYVTLSLSKEDAEYL